MHKEAPFPAWGIRCCLGEKYDVNKKFYEKEEKNGRKKKCVKGEESVQKAHLSPAG